MSRYHDDEDLLAARAAILEHFNPPNDRHSTWWINPGASALAVLDAVVPRIAARVAAGALEAAIHMLDDHDAAETLARLADQWREQEDES